MEIYKQSNCDYFLYIKEGGIDVSVNSDTRNSGKDIYNNGISLHDASGGISPYDGHTVYVHFTPSAYEKGSNLNDSLNLKTEDDPDNSIVYKLNSFTGYEPELDSSIKFQKNIENTSYQLLRVNPKLTGNIKVVVDSQSNLYLDTFKVSPALSQQKYRKIKLNPDEYYGRTLMAKLRGMTSDDLYKVEDGCYELFAPCGSLEDQYYDKYNSGVRTNSDHLYSENYSLLAPLHIGKLLPDFFLIFKIKDYANIKTNADRIRHFLENGEIVKVFDLRDGTNLGKYIRNIQKHAKDFVGDLYTAYDYNAFNIYNGISLERGVVASIYESASLETSLMNQTAMNEWYTLGFQRNRIVSKDIVNFEFMFDDLSEKMFSLNTYFGLYIKLNGEEENFSITAIDTVNHELIYDSSLMIGKEFDPSDSQNRSIIYGMTTPETFIRTTTNIQSYDSSALVKEYVLKPYKCLFTSEKNDNPVNHSFLSFTLKKPLIAGEHFRMIDKSRKIVFEILCSNYVDEDRNISDVLHSVQTINGMSYDVYTVSIYNMEHIFENNTEASHIASDIVHIKSAFDIIAEYTDLSVKCNLLTGNSVSIEYVSETSPSAGNENILFQKFMSNAGFNGREIGITVDEGISFFGLEDIPAVEVGPDDAGRQYLYPDGFESLGNRICTTVCFVGSSGYVSIEKDPSDSITPYKSVIFPKLVSDGSISYSLIDTTSVGYVIRESGSEVVRYATTGRRILGYDPKFPYMVNLGTGYAFDKVYLYQNYPINAGICSILPVKDFYTDVIDSENRISTNRKDGNISETSGEYQSTWNVAESSISDGMEESICDYVSRNEIGKPNGYITNDSKLDEFLNANINSNHTKSDISLVSPYCCKWQSVGTDHVGKPIRVMFPYYGKNSGMNSSLTDSSSYFLADNDASTFIGFMTTESNLLRYDSRFDSYTDMDNLAWDASGNVTMNKVDDFVRISMDYLHGIKITDPEFSNLYTRGYTTEFSFRARVSPDAAYDECQLYLLMLVGINSGAPVWRNLLNAPYFKLTKEWNTFSYDYKFIISDTYTDFGTIFLLNAADNIQDQGTIQVDMKDVSFHIKSNSDYEKYINGNLSRMNHFDYRNYILNGNGSIDDLLYTEFSRKPKMSKIYKYGSDSIELISGGLKLRISSNSRTTIDMSKYNGYSGIIICMDGNNPDHPTSCELIIDEISEEIAFVIYNGLALNKMVYPGENSNPNINKYFGIAHRSPVSDTEVGFAQDGNEDLYIPDDASLYDDAIISGSNAGYSLLIQSSPVIDRMSFDEDANIMFMSKTKPSMIYDSDNPESILSLLSDASLCVDSSILDTNAITSKIIENETYKQKYMNNAFVYSYGQTTKIPGNRYADDALTLRKVKSLVNDCALIVKTKFGTNDYTGKSNLLNVQVVDPVEFSRITDSSYNNVITSGRVHPSFAEPVMRDVMRFDFGNTSVGYTTSASCQGCSIKVDDVSDIDQTWIRKYLVPGGTLAKSNGIQTTSINLIKGISPMFNCWEQDMFRVFSNGDSYTSENGVQAGYEKNTYFASRGLNLKSKHDSESVVDSITISDWIGTTINVSNHTITLNITDSIISKILSEEGYNDNWRNVDVEDTDISKYAENNILRYLDVTNYTKFTLLCDYKSSELGFVSDEGDPKYEVVPNLENELVYTDNKYYMIIKNLENRSYSASMLIPTI